MIYIEHKIFIKCIVGVRDLVYKKCFCEFDDTLFNKIDYNLDVQVWKEVGNNVRGVLAAKCREYLQ